MSTAPRRTQPNRKRPPARPAPKKGRGTWLFAALGVVVLLALVLGLALGGSGHKAKAPADTSDPGTVLRAVSSVPPAVASQIGRGDAKSLPKAVSGGAPLTSGGKPEVLFIGAGYCPYCAAERWPIAIALSRFGTLTNVGLTSSSSTDIYPSTPTLSFHGAGYSSQYLTFAAVEETTNEPNGHGGYVALDTPTQDQQATMQALDPGGYIPFVDLGGRYVISGATYDPNVLQGHSTQDVAASLASPGTSISRAVVGTANTITASLCQLTNQQPSSVCADPSIQTLEKALG